MEKIKLAHSSYPFGNLLPMLSASHEGLAGIATLDPGRTAEALRTLFKLPIPETGNARVISGNLTECVPTEYRADAALLYGEEVDPFGVIVEVQLGRDDHKRMSWPAYITNLRARDKWALRSRLDRVITLLLSVSGRV